MKFHLEKTATLFLRHFNFMQILVCSWALPIIWCRKQQTPIWSLSRLAKLMILTCLAAAAATMPGSLLVPYTVLAEIALNDLLLTMQRGFMEQPTITKLGILVVALAFLAYIGSAILKGHKIVVNPVLLMGLVGLAVFSPFAFFDPVNPVADLLYLCNLHLKVKSVRELIMDCLPSFNCSTPD